MRKINIAKNRLLKCANAILKLIFSKMLISMISYMTGREIMCKHSNRIKLDAYKNRPKKDHYGRWLSVKTRNKLRLTDVVVLIRFFCFETRDLNFAPFIKQLDKAISQLGRVSTRIFDFNGSFIFCETIQRIVYFWTSWIDSF